PVRASPGPGLRLSAQQHAALQHHGLADAGAALRLLVVGLAAVHAARRSRVRGAHGPGRGPRLRAGHGVAPAPPARMTRPLVSGAAAVLAALWLAGVAAAGAPTDQLLGSIDGVVKILYDPEPQKEYKTVACARSNSVVRLHVI